MIFEENSGLLVAHLVDAIDECIDMDPSFQLQRTGEGATTSYHEEPET